MFNNIYSLIQITPLCKKFIYVHYLIITHYKNQKTSLFILKELIQEIKKYILESLKLIWFYIVKKIFLHAILQVKIKKILDNNQVIEQLKMGNQYCKNQYLIIQFQDFDDVIAAVNKITPNPKDVRIYLEQIDEQLYLTWSITQQDETIINKQTYIEFIQELEIVLLEPSPMIIMPTYILNQMANIAKNYDTSLKLNFYKISGLYSVEIIVQLENDVPSFSSLFLASQHKTENLKQIDSFFIINKNYIQQFIDLTSIEEQVVISLDSQATSSLVLNYFTGREVELGVVKQFIIQRMYN